MKLDTERVLMAKDEGLISDVVYKNFIRDLELEKLMPTMSSIKKVRQKWNNFVAEKLQISKLNNLADGTEVNGYCINIRSTIELILTIVMLFGSGSILNNHLEFKVSLDGRNMNGRKEILVGLIPMNMGFVV